ncbi:MAG: ribonuclease P protein component [Gammaproteobacteria bacterium]|nr:ribonuclease P protein component [Gammaproteobacteria bacterium]
MKGPISACFSKNKRLLNAGDYSRVFETASAKASHKHLLMLGSVNDLPDHRLGLVIAKKHVRQAVNRNRIKRLAREFFRHQPSGQRNLDVVILARPGLGELENAQVSSILAQLWSKLEHNAQQRGH